MGWVVKTSPRACESVVLRARLSKCRLRRKSAPAGSPRSRRRACSPKACAPARGSRCARFDSGRGRFAAPLFLNGFVVLSKDSSPLKRRSCYQGRTQHSGYSPDGSPRFLDQSFDTRRPQPPRLSSTVAFARSSPWIPDFGTSGILGRLASSVSRPNRVHLRYGSRLRFERLRSTNYSILRSRSYMSYEHFTWQAPFFLLD